MLLVSFVTANDKTEIINNKMWLIYRGIQRVAFHLSLINISVLNIADKQTLSQAITSERKNICFHFVI